MNHDPKGFYARLGVDWDAGAETIHVAFRRKARVLHPDVPETGNAAAFVAVKEAYDTLSNPLSRAAYDRSARAVSFSEHAVHVADYEPGEIPPAPPPPPVYTRTRGPRLSDLPIFVWAGFGVMVVIAAFEALVHLTDEPMLPSTDIRAMAPTVASAPAPKPQEPIWLTAAANAYVLPAASPAVVLRHDQTSGNYVPIAQLPPFSAVQALRLIRPDGLMEIRLNDTTNGYIDATRLTPGNVLAARRAFCAYNAGAPPLNAEILARNATGPVQIRVQNRTGEPLVVKLRDPHGIPAATVYVGADDDAQVPDLPEGSYQPEYAVGELWSRTCDAFAGGMRAQRFASAVNLTKGSVLVIPPDLLGAESPVDISDKDFARAK